MFALIVRIFIALSTSFIIFEISTNSLVEDKVPAYLLLGIFVICLFVSSYFIDIQVHAA